MDSDTTKALYDLSVEIINLKERLDALEAPIKPSDPLNDPTLWKPLE